MLIYQNLIANLGLKFISRRKQPFWIFVILLIF